MPSSKLKESLAALLERLLGHLIAAGADQQREHAGADARVCGARAVSGASDGGDGIGAGGGGEGCECFLGDDVALSVVTSDADAVHVHRPVHLGRRRVAVTPGVLERCPGPERVEISRGHVQLEELPAQPAQRVGIRACRVCK